jgi:hypothetical protein
MRKVALLAAVVLAAAFTVTSADAATKAKAKPDPAIAAQENSAKLFRDGLNPYEATAKAAAKPAKKMKKATKTKKAKKK